MTSSSGCPHCGRDDFDSLGHHIGSGRCPEARSRIDDGDINEPSHATVEAYKDVSVGGSRASSHRADFARSVRTISWDDVPTLDSAGPDVVVTDGGNNEVRELADKLEQDGVWPA